MKKIHDMNPQSQLELFIEEDLLLHECDISECKLIIDLPNRLKIKFNHVDINLIEKLFNEMLAREQHNVKKHLTDFHGYELDTEGDVWVVGYFSEILPLRKLQLNYINTILTSKIWNNNG